MKGRLLVTGGHGMVGRNIVEHPAAQEWELLTPRSSELDLTDAVAVTDYFAANQPDAVIHAAGKVGGIQANIDNPLEFLGSNLRMGQNVIMAAYEAGVTRLLNISSSCVYPAKTASPLREEMVLTGAFEPTNEGYALAKVAAMKLCEYIVRTDPRRHFKTLVPCNQFGRYDHFDLRTSHLIPAIIHKMRLAKKSGATSIEIWGSGTVRREFMYAGDLADAVMRALADIAHIPDVMNIGVGHDHSIEDYYRVIAYAVGWSGNFTHDLSKPEGMRQKLCAVDRQTAWGWAPKVSLQDGVAATIRYYQEQMNDQD